MEGSASAGGISRKLREAFGLRAVYRRFATGDVIGVNDPKHRIICIDSKAVLKHTQSKRFARFFQLRL